ncbi:hypothetical protein B0H17DRAFT_1207526 [Mycena rosella]|uniref:Uncharacterized protein n=1 Tax=Mycena rosella TaxID=1033263 RepID=A0AAD7D346_MYCRO|nr:hypothetical protein B0H17DRAFT_1207526 [Mycena rosella]
MLGMLLESEELKDKGPLPQKGKKRKHAEGPAEEMNDDAPQTKKAKRAKAAVEKRATRSTAVSEVLHLQIVTEDKPEDVTEETSAARQQYNVSGMSREEDYDDEYIVDLVESLRNL